jgi:dihydrofolate reductase
MSKIVVLSFITLDGVVQAPGGPNEDQEGGFEFGGWTVPYFDDFSGKIMAKQMAGRYHLLLGRKTYDIFADYWPGHSDEWSQVNRMTKYVVSKTLRKPAWAHTVVIQDVEALKKLISQHDLQLQVHGSGKLVQSLLKHDLVDELWLKFFPVTLGKGKRLFAEGTIPTAFRLTKSETSPSGVVFVNYKRAGSVKTGSF